MHLNWTCLEADRWKQSANWKKNIPYSSSVPLDYCYGPFARDRVHYFELRRAHCSVSRCWKLSETEREREKRKKIMIIVSWRVNRWIRINFALLSCLQLDNIENVLYHWIFESNFPHTTCHVSCVCVSASAKMHASQSEQMVPFSLFCFVWCVNNNFINHKPHPITFYWRGTQSTCFCAMRSGTIHQFNNHSVHVDVDDSSKLIWKKKSSPKIWLPFQWKKDASFQNHANSLQLCAGYQKIYGNVSRREQQAPSQITQTHELWTRTTSPNGWRTRA